MELGNPLSRFAKMTYCGLIRIGAVLQPLILLVFRLHWGWKFFNTGWGKLTNHAHTVEFFSSLGVPLPEINAWFIGGLECFGGLLLLIGLCSRPIALMMICNMLVAYLSVEEDRAALLNVFSDASAFLEAEPFFFLLMSLLVFAFGPGMISVDALLKRKVFRSSLNAEVCCTE